MNTLISHLTTMLLVLSSTPGQHEHSVPNFEIHSHSHLSKTIKWSMATLVARVNKETGLHCGYSQSNSKEYLGTLNCGSVDHLLEDLGTGETWVVECRPDVYSTTAQIKGRKWIYSVPVSGLYLGFEGNWVGTKDSKCERAFKKFLKLKNLPFQFDTPSTSALAAAFLQNGLGFVQAELPQSASLSDSATYEIEDQSYGDCYAVFFKSKTSAIYYSKKQKYYKYASLIYARGQEFDLWIVTDYQSTDSDCTTIMSLNTEGNSGW